MKDKAPEPPRVAMFTLYVTFLSIALAGYFGRNGIPNFDWLDWTCIVLTFTLVGWLLSGGDRPVDADGHESTGEGFAFRLGKKLNRVLHNFKR